MILTGIGVGSRAVRAEVFRLQPRAVLPPHAKRTGEAKEEIALIDGAVARLESMYLEKISAAESADLREILQAQLALATDPELTDVAHSFCNSGWNATTAIQLAMNEFKSLLEGAGGEFGERIADLDEIAYRLCLFVLGNPQDTEIPQTGQFIVVAEDLTPMDTVSFTAAIVGVITEKGGPTSHTAIVCRSRDIPALVACSGASQLKTGEIILLDPDNSQAIINGDLPSNLGNWWDKLLGEQPLLLPVLANVGSVADSQRAHEASGIGLLRTELFFLNHKNIPNLSEQKAIYTEVFRAAPSGEIIVRTLDAGSDKPIPFLEMGAEENPALGVRGQRLSALAPDFYRNQLLAIAESAIEVQNEGKEITVSVMAPMISTISEAKDFAEQAKSAGIARVGIMVEVPAIIPFISHLNGILDFISVGTNDLSQYLFAADRTNSGVAHLLNPWEPALLNQLQLISTNARAAGIKAGVCGEAASDPLLCIVLAGLGFDSVSASVSALAAVKKVLSSVSRPDSEKAAKAALAEVSAHGAKSAARSTLNLG